MVKNKYNVTARKKNEY